MRRWIVLGLLATAGSAFADKPITLTILHTNDLHAHLVPTVIRGKSYGGYARLATLIRQIRAKEKNVLVVNAGDTFQGTLYFNAYEGLADGAVLSAIGIDAGTVGNHEFDKGPDPLAVYADAIGWPLVAANLDLSQEPKLRGKIPKYVIKQVGGEKVALVGIATPETPDISGPGPTVKFLDPVPTVQATVDELTKSGINKIIVLSHLGYGGDRKLATQLRDVDLIVGGHSHTPLGTPDLPGWPKAGGPYPTYEKDATGKSIPVVQAWEWGKVLGKLQVEFDGKGNVKKIKDAAPVVVDESIPEDRSVKAMIQAFERPLLTMQNAPVGEAAVTLSRTGTNGENLMANVMADALYAKAKEAGAVVAFVNQGGVRAEIEAGKINYGQALSVMPFNNTITLLDVTGAELRLGIEQGLGTGGQLTPSAGTAYAAEGKRVTKLIVNGVPVEDAKVYRIALMTFTANGGDALYAFRDAKGRRIDTGFLDIDAFVDYLKVKAPIAPKLEGRVDVKRG